MLRARIGEQTGPLEGGEACVVSRGSVCTRVAISALPEVEALGGAHGLLGGSLAVPALSGLSPELCCPPGHAVPLSLVWRLSVPSKQRLLVPQVLL